MNDRVSLWRKCLVAVGYCTVCVTIGILISISFWAVYIVGEGHRISSALNGEVEDALGKLQAVVALGCLSGGVIGVVYGLIKATRIK
jgi:hypothetical protein